MTVACVPLPAPGAPSRMSLMVGRSSLQAGETSIIGEGAFVPCRARSGKTRTVVGGEQSACPLEVFRRVDAEARLTLADVHGDAFAVPENAQLLEPLDGLERARRKERKAPQEPGAIRVQADMAQRRRGGFSKAAVARPRDRRPREIKSAP